MKLAVVLMVLMLLLPGCLTKPDYETMSDSYIRPAEPAAGEVSLLLPVDAEVVEAEHERNGKLWICEDYWVCLQTMDAGDMESTLRELTGYGSEQLSIFCVDTGEQKRYECVWLSAGETGDQINRAVILDDGSYHYALTLHTAAEDAGALAGQWQNIITTFAVNTGP